MLIFPSVHFLVFLIGLKVKYSNYSKSSLTALSLFFPIYIVCIFCIYINIYISLKI